MNKIVALLVIVALLLLSGCGDIASAFNERQRLQTQEAQAEANEAQAEADEAEWRAKQTKYEWDGRAFFIGVLGATGLPYYFGSLCFVAGLFVFYLAAFHEPKKKGDERDAD